VHEVMLVLMACLVGVLVFMTVPLAMVSRQLSRRCDQLSVRNAELDRRVLTSDQEWRDEAGLTLRTISASVEELRTSAAGVG
jgi:hypothetical protein